MGYCDQERQSQLAGFPQHHPTKFHADLLRLNQPPPTIAASSAFCAVRRAAGDGARGVRVRATRRRRWASAGAEGSRRSLGAGDLDPGREDGVVHALRGEVWVEEEETSLQALWALRVCVLFCPGLSASFYVWGSGADRVLS